MIIVFLFKDLYQLTGDYDTSQLIYFSSNVLVIQNIRVYKYIIPNCSVYP